MNTVSTWQQYVEKFVTKTERYLKLQDLENQNSFFSEIFLQQLILVDKSFSSVQAKECQETLTRSLLKLFQTTSESQLSSPVREAVLAVEKSWSGWESIFERVRQNVESFDKIQKQNMIRVFLMFKKEFQQLSAENEAGKKMLGTQKGKQMAEVQSQNKTLRELLNHKERIIIQEKERRRKIKRFHLIENSSLMFNLGALREITESLENNHRKMTEELQKIVQSNPSPDSLSEQIKKILAINHAPSIVKESELTNK